MGSHTVTTGSAQCMRLFRFVIIACVAFVSNFVAKYEKKVADSFVSKLYSEGDNASDMTTFYCTDSVACSVKWLNEEVDKRVAAGKGKLAHVVSCAPVIAEWVKENKNNSKGGDVAKALGAMEVS